MDYDRVRVKTDFGSVSALETGEYNYFGKFKTPTLIKQYGPVTHVEYSRSRPAAFAITSSTRVQVFSASTATVTKTFSRFKDIAYSGTFRADGQLLAAGDATGLVQLLDAHSRSILRQFKGHTAAVQVVRFSLDNVRVFTASDDKTVRVWDISTGETELKLEGHEDLIRAGAAVPGAPSLFVTGSYDHTVRLWDIRTGSEPVAVLDHGHPVEALQPLPSGSVILSAGVGNEIIAWDIFNRGEKLSTMKNHQKTVTCLALNAKGTRLFSGSLDQQLKVYDISTHSVIQSQKYPAPILTIAVSPTENQIVAGLVDGMLSIRTKRKSNIPRPKKRTFVQGSRQYYARGATWKPGHQDVIVHRTQKPDLSEYDKLFKAFRHADALDAALRTNNHFVMYSVLDELRLRKSLGVALAGRTEETLEPFITYLCTNIQNPNYSQLLIPTTYMLLDMYESVIGLSPRIIAALKTLKNHVREEVLLQKRMLEMIGQLGMLLHGAPTVAKPIG
eukprot:TRINITY_DN6275_c0_g1_i1.p1 TRINITY_DN6275_c0_g1~~TRINITY_DN6275_c0_g1_i1.p1  ORF type:complete len:502 (+),score=46.79 TRINITY_DN6275_c0_g1_i1:169-1674(+)